MTDLAKYVVALESETAKYRRELDRANKKLSRFHKQQTTTLDRIKKQFNLLAVAASAAIFTNYIKQTIDAADKANKLSQQLGVATDTLTGLSLAVGLSGASLKDLETGITRLNRSISDAAVGLSTQKRAFDGLNVAVANTDGTLRDTEDVLRDIANRFARMEDGRAQNGRAQEIFGRSGAKLIPLLNGGSDGMDRLIERGRQLGLVWSEEAAKAAEDFNDNLFVLQSMAQGAANSFAQDLLPSLNKITAGLIAFRGETEEASLFASVLGKVIENQVRGVLVLAGGFEQLAHRAAAYIAAGQKMLTLDFDGASVILDELAAKHEEIEKRIAKSIDLLTSDPGDSGLTDLLDEYKAALAALRELQTGEGDGEGGAAAESGASGSDAEENLERTRVALFELETMADQAANDIQGRFAEFLFDPVGEGFEGMVTGFADALRRMAAEAAAAQIFGLILGGFGGGGGSIPSPAVGSGTGATPPFNPYPGMSIFGGTRARGGTVLPGEKALVGERGPEFVEPVGAVRISPVGGRQVIINHNERIETNGSAEEIQQVLEEQDRRTTARVFDLMRRGHR